MFHLALLALLAAHGADTATTMYAIGARPAAVREWNPVMRPLVRHPAAFGAVKLGTAGVTSWALCRTRAAHPRLTVWSASASAIGLSAVAVHNARVLRR